MIWIMTKKLQKQIKSRVFEGKLPLAFLNSEIVEVPKRKNQIVYLNKKYGQRVIPRGYIETMISKIHDLP